MARMYPRRPVPRIDSLLRESQKINFTEGISEAFNQKGLRYLVNLEYDSAYLYIDSAIQFARLIMDKPDFYIAAKGNLGNYYDNIGIPDSMVIFHDELFNLAIQNNRWRLSAFLAAYLAKNQIYAGDSDSAHYFIDSAFVLMRKAKLTNGIEFLYQIKAAIDKAGGNVEGNKENLRMAIHYAKRVGNSKDLLGAMINLGNIYARSSNVDSSLFWYKKARHYADSLGIIQYQVITSNYLGSIHYHLLKDFEAAEKYFAESRKLNLKEEIHLSWDLYLNMAEFYKRWDKHDSAYKYWGKVLEIYPKFTRQKLEKAAQARNLELKMKYDKEKLAKENAELEVQKKKSQMAMVGFAAIGSILCLLAVFFYSRQRFLARYLGPAGRRLETVEIGEEERPRAIPVDSSRIMAIEKNKDTLYVYVKDETDPKEFSIALKLEDIHAEYEKGTFIRIHQSILVNPKFVKGWASFRVSPKSRNYRPGIVLVSGHKFNIGPKYETGIVKLIDFLGKMDHT